jgi:HPt (histidine-containing phosphotransfer) domain-containing protein
MSDIPLVDPAQLDRLREWGGPELQKKMIELFLSHGQERLDQIREGVSTQVFEKAETGAHTLKSSAGNVGAHRVQGLAQEAELMAEDEDMAKLEGLLSELETEFEAACDALKTVLEGIEE